MIIGVEGRLYPDQDQFQIILQHAGCCHHLYNRFLNYAIEMYTKYHISTNYYDWTKILTTLRHDPSVAWIGEVSAEAQQQVLRDLDTAFKNFYKHGFGFPAYRKYSNTRSFRFTNQGIKLLSHRYIKLPKIGKIKYKGLKLPKEYCILSATVHVTTDRYVTISLHIETPDPEPLPEVNSNIGIDVGVKDMAVCSNGLSFPRLQIIKVLNKKKDYYASKLSTAKKGSKNYYKWFHKYMKSCRKISNLRKGYAQNIADQLTKDNQIICVETLSVSDMISADKNRFINRAVMDAGMSQLLYWIEYLCRKRGRIFVKIDQWYPSSQVCNNCGYRNKELKDLSSREWDCPNCKSHNLRDFNAAKNIRDAGLATLGDKPKIIGSAD